MCVGVSAVRLARWCIDKPEPYVMCMMPWRDLSMLSASIWYTRSLQSCIPLFIYWISYIGFYFVAQPARARAQQTLANGHKCTTHMCTYHFALCIAWCKCTWIPLTATLSLSTFVSLSLHSSKKCCTFDYVARARRNEYVVGVCCLVDFG